MLSVKQDISNNCEVQGRFCGCSQLHDVKLTQSQRKTRLLWMALGLLTIFLVAEWSTGLWSHSLSLQADAGHMLSDVAALGLTLLASWLAQRPATGQATFGHRRVEILAALANSLGLVALSIAIAWEAINRFQTPEPVSGLPMLIVAGVGLVVNTLNINLLHKHSHDDLNLRGAFLHMVSDAASSVGIILAALAVHFLNWLWADAAVSLLVACLTGASALPLMQESLAILMEYAPHSIDPARVEVSLKSFAAVERVEKLYIWTISAGQVVLSAHLTVESLNPEERDRLVKQLQTHLKREFGISESVLQLTSRQSREPVALHPLFRQNLVAMFPIGQGNSDPI